MENLLINHRELDFVKHNFYKNVYDEFGIEHINFEVANWEKLSWKEFKKELMKLGATFNAASEAEWETYFLSQKLKIEQIRKRLDAGKKKARKEELVYSF